jgi:hypothetical protein
MQWQSSSVSAVDANDVVIDAKTLEANDAAPTNTEQSSNAACGAASKTLVTPATG